MKALWLAAALVTLLLAHAVLDEDAGVRRWRHLRSELADARGRIEALRGETDRLQREAERLEVDDFAVERAIREELGLVRPGQTLLRLRGADVSSGRIQ